MALSDRDRRVLDLERDWWVSARTKQVAIADRLGCSPTAYYAALRRVVSDPDAYAYDPLVVKRLRRRASRRRRERWTGGTRIEHRPR